MAAPEGNDFNLKWKTPEERKQACEEYCKHIESGYSKESFKGADSKTIKSYCINFPEDFPPEKIKEAERSALFYWEEIGMRGSQGKIAFWNPGGWIFNMKNRFGWRDQIEIKDPSRQRQIIFNIGPSPFIDGTVKAKELRKKELLEKVRPKIIEAELVTKKPVTGTKKKLSSKAEIKKSKK